jgi:allantoinase
MPILAKRGLPLLVHAELDCSHIGSSQADGSESDGAHTDSSQAASDFAAAPHKYSNFLNSRPRSWENEAIKLMIDLCREFDCRVHIVHLSSSDALPMIAAAKKEGLKLTVETCPHYLTLVAEDIADGDTRFKCTPPIRERENCEKLWQGLADGTIDFIVSDHSPCTPELKLLKEGNFDKAWGGISSLQFGYRSLERSQKTRTFFGPGQ